MRDQITDIGVIHIIRWRDQISILDTTHIIASINRQHLRKINTTLDTLRNIIVAINRQQNPASPSAFNNHSIHPYIPKTRLLRFWRDLSLSTNKYLNKLFAFLIHNDYQIHTPSHIIYIHIHQTNIHSKHTFIHSVLSRYLRQNYY